MPREEVRRAAEEALREERQRGKGDEGKGEKLEEEEAKEDKAKEVKDTGDMRRVRRVHDSPSVHSKLLEIITRDGLQACSAQEVIST